MEIIFAYNATLYQIQNVWSTHCAKMNEIVQSEETLEAILSRLV